ncbi:MAG: hypothetical protein H2172_01075 [Opitutus sp.]|nr:hypothetical protein [Opitutus sp.]MCS6247927.1 hypothetical protein [Opitutus sp.]MCS6274388.1 hypothetical protein [Opitutus sp.]MCS6277199.1 hypothetical protein [Opitutus sp.]MCS6300321.1 hypothetical protein [Opitutus sp.]
MKKLITPALLGSLALLAFSVSTASAQDAQTEKPVSAAVLKKYDINKDGKLDEAERTSLLAEKKAAAAKKAKTKADADMKPDTVK